MNVQDYLHTHRLSLADMKAELDKVTFDVLTAEEDLTRHRAETIASRIRIVAGAFSLLTVAWIALDRLVLPWPNWGWLAGLRLFASLVFIVPDFPDSQTAQKDTASGTLFVQ